MRTLVLGALALTGAAAIIAATSGGEGTPGARGAGGTGGGVPGTYWPPDGPVAPVGPPRQGLPQGKGVFVRSVKHGGTPERFVERAKWWGLDWVMLQAIWQKADASKTVRNNPGTLAEYALALQDAGVRVWLFGWPRPCESEQEDFVATMQIAAAATRADGVVINPEKPWYRGHKEDAQRFVERLRTGLPESSVGMTSYGGGPPMHRPFPWAEFAELDFGIPQVYDTKHERREDYPKRAVQAWADAGYISVPAWGASSAHTPEQMADISRRTPLPASAACWWDLYWLLHGSKGASTARKRSAFVRQYSIPKATVA